MLVPGGFLCLMNYNNYMGFRNTQEKLENTFFFCRFSTVQRQKEVEKKKEYIAYVRIG